MGDSANAEKKNGIMKGVNKKKAEVKEKYMYTDKYKIWL